MKYYNINKLDTLKQIESWLLENFKETANSPFEFKNVSENFKQIIDTGNGITYLAKDEDKFVGFIAGYLNPNIFNIEEPNSYIVFLNVLKDYRKQGVGYKLLSLFEKWSKDKKVSNILTGVSLKEGIIFYKNKNFKELETVMYKRIGGEK